MKAKKYVLKVCEGAMDWVHGGGYDINEVYVPELNLFINEKMAFISEGKDAKSRVKEAKGVKDIVLGNDEELKLLAEIVATHKTLEAKLRKEIFGVDDEDQG
jgi:hypothetical protein